jgi:peptide chain release factor 2
VIWNLLTPRSARRCATCGSIFDAPRLKAELAALEEKIADPALWADAAKSQPLMRERKRLEGLLADDASLERSSGDIAAYFDLMREGEVSVEPELKREIDALAAFTEALESKTMLSEENDGLNAIVTVHPGAGGTESQDWAEMLMRMYLRWAERQGFKTERRHTSFASVYVSPEIDDSIVIDIKTEDLRIDTYRSGGKGGQHVNTTDSAVRITHLPTGLVTGCQNERSQHKNKDRAMKMMRSKLYEYELDKKKAISRKLEDSKLEINFGSQIRSYVLQPYRMAKDLRTRVEVGDVDKVLDGSLEPFIRGYLKMRREGGVPAPIVDDVD